ncbi:MAG: hypothetical protein ABSG41_01835 [Bryobacteraceae bacterium]
MLTLPAVILFFFFLLANAVSGQSLFVKPVKVFGDPNFIGTASNPLAFDSFGPNVVEGRELSQPLGIAVDTSASPPNIYIADTANNRVLGYRYNTQVTAGSFADLVLGQPNRFSNIPQGPGNTFSTGINNPTGMAVDSAGNLYVADTGNNRILRYPQPFTQPAGYQFPNMIIGQTSFASSGANTGGVKASTLSLAGGRTGLAFDSAGNLWVTDTGNNRVLRFPVAVLTAGTNGPSADIAVGQADLVSSVAATSRTAKTGLSQPVAIAFDPSGNMFVADALQRVVVYPPGATFSSSASRILGVPVQGQAQTVVEATVLGKVLGVAAAGPNILVADTSTNRILVYGSVASWPPETTTQFSPSANAVIGQTTFAGSAANGGNGQPSASTFSVPVDMAFSQSELFVADSGNNRILVFPSAVSGPSGTASRVIGQLDFPYRAPNLVEGKEFGFSGSTSSASGSAILDYSSTPPHLYVADTLNNRILGFRNFTSMTNGQVADIVIGQPDMFHTVINYPTNDPTMPNSQGLDGPTSLVVDSAGNLYVADTFNSRILRFPTPFHPPSGSTTLESADLVLGQATFMSTVTDPTAGTMSAPISLAFTQAGANASIANSGWLVAADANQNRVLLFQKPFSNGMNANVVLGQSGFATTAAGSAQSTSGFSSPRGVAVDLQDRVLVADAGNARVQVFDQAGNLSNGASASFSLTTGLSQPVAIAISPEDGTFWVADTGQNHLLHFPSVDQLPTENYASDATLPAVSPRSGFVDQYDNLLVADGINRLLYFAPQIAVVNAANYIVGRPLAPGAFAALFPSVNTNPIANGTESNPGTFPLPTTLADTQVLVNGAPSALFYVSPGQINVPLSLSLPTSGTVDLQVIRQSTGQVYGGAELPLAAASPGLFTVNSTGSGPVAALNQDSTQNSSSNPIPRGQTIQIYATGQGPVSNPPPDGTPSTGQVPTAATPQVIIGTTFVPSSSIQYSGLAPNLVGLWQINVQIPMTATTGNAVPIQVFMDSIPSNNPASLTQVAPTISIK